MKVMNKIEILKGKVEQLENELGKSHEKHAEVRDQKKSDLYHIHSKYFSHVLKMGDTIKVYEDQFIIVRPRNEDNRPDSLITLYFRNEDWRKDTFTKVETSFYSTNSNDDFELNRMVTIGQIGQVLLDSKDDLLHDINNIVSSYSKKLKTISKNSWDIDKKISDFEKEIKSLEEQLVLDEAEVNGIKFKMENKSVNTLPNFDVKSDRTVYNVKGLKILKYTASGKSADVALKIITNTWDSDTQGYKNIVENRIVDKVRTSNIKSFLNYNLDRISAS